MSKLTAFPAGRHDDQVASTAQGGRLGEAPRVGGSKSKGTATGAFIFNPLQRTLSYSITYQGLGDSGAGTVALYDFGAGGNGEIIRVLCGKDAPACPAGGSTIAGRLEPGGASGTDERLIAEFDNGRVYVQIADASGAPQIRGQLSPNTAVTPVMNYVARLQPAANVDSKATGTAVSAKCRCPRPRCFTP